MTFFSVSDAARMAGVTRRSIAEQIANGELKTGKDGIALDELIRVYPELKPLAKLKIRKVKQRVPTNLADGTAADQVTEAEETGESDAVTMALLVRELEWHKTLLEQTNNMMSKQMADQRALIADQARRLDEKDRFWARQVEIAQSLLPAPAPRKKFLGLF